MLDALRPSPASRAGVGVAVLAAALALVAAGNAPAHTYTVQPGDTLWWVATRNGASVSAVAAASGRAPEALLPIGAMLRVPPAASTASGGGSTTGSGAASSGYSGGPGPASVVAIHSPLGATSLAPAAASAWEAMRQASLRELGIDLYPAGPASAYRTYAQQVEMWRRYQAGIGPLAAPPGTSAHEDGLAVDLATPQMRQAVDILGPRFGWAKTEAPGEWFHVNYVGGG